VAVNGFSTPGLNDYFGVEQHVYSGEVRLSCPDPDATLGWVGGLIASHEHTHNPVWPAGGFYDDMVVDRNQVAAFGQLALKVTTRLTANAGVRIGHSEHQDATIAPPAFYDAASDTWSAPRFGLSWQLDGDNLIYLTAARGYGSGGVYPLNPVAFPPDTLWSYEVGSKHDLLDHRLRIQAGLFHIRWNNPWAPGIDKLTQQEHDDIPGKAVSNGFDLATQALITRHTRAAVEVAYANAHVTQTVTVNEVLLVRGGAHLPISPWNATASLEQEFPLRGDVTASLRLEDAFRGNSGITYLNDPTTLTSPEHVVSHTEPSVNILNIRGAVTWPSLEVAASLRNALNSHPLLSGLANGVDNTDPTQVFTLVPRTLSASAAWRF
jgi:iron complex outermembrane recepter protein